MKHILSMIMALSMFDPNIAFELALSTMRKAEQTLVPRSQCDVCHGTGKVTAGDTVVVVERDCTNCFDDSGDSRPALILKSKYWEIHTIDNCAPCKVLKNNIEALKKAGWQDKHFKFVKGGAQNYPTSHLVYDGKILESYTGALSSKQLANRYIYWSTPTEWRDKCKKYTGELWEVEGKSVREHLLQDHGLQSWQIEGLTDSELKIVHSILHE